MDLGSARSSTRPLLPGAHGPAPFEPQGEGWTLVTFSVPEHLRDLRHRLRMPTAMLQEEHALCLAEQIFGQARDTDDFAMVDISEGLGMGVVSGGRLIAGCEGYGGEIGHMTVRPDGEPCGCGNRGCLETVATDRAFARAVSALVQRPMTIEEAVAAVRAGRVSAGQIVSDTLEYLAWGLGAVINIFNPSLLIVYGRMFDARDGRPSSGRRRHDP